MYKWVFELPEYAQEGVRFLVTRQAELCGYRGKELFDLVNFCMRSKLVDLSDVDGMSDYMGYVFGR